MYKKYRKDVELSKNRDLNIIEEEKTKIELKTYAIRTPYGKHFQVIEKNGEVLRVACRHCQSTLIGYVWNNRFLFHLQVFLFEFEH